MPNLRADLHRASRAIAGRLFRPLVASLLGGLLASAPASATPMLDPYVSIAPGSGDGLNIDWVQVADDWHFSNYVYNGQTIGSTAWGSGFWAVDDIATAFGLADGDANLVARSSGVSSGLSYANAIYNDLWGSGSGWDKDYLRTVAPVVADSGQQTNYAASITGYIYIAQPGRYDFGLFVDDAFSLSLIGAGGTLGVTRETFIGSSGRDFYTLSGANGGSIELGVGFYGLQLDYFNRLEAGVLELGWWQPGDETWHPIDGNLLYSTLPASQVPEPSPLLLLMLGGGVLAASRRRRTPAR
jgi:hypothetical protein